ncbi:STAS-like domain-containing protein [Candidatus Woesearchaeota archaeon]|nr:STAS-like domain-containing protein [Candidatus Woesearchaeota archaeon]
MTIEINIFNKAGNFAENKDVAKEIRITEIMPALNKGEDVVINFDKVDSATQSFMHALLSDVIRTQGIDVLDKIRFKSCNEIIQKIIRIVIDYMQQED